MTTTSKLKSSLEKNRFVVTAETSPPDAADPGTVLNRVSCLKNIVDAVNEVGATPSSLIAILDALKSSGSLRAELIVL